MISVVVPVHDEERSVALLYDELRSALEPLDAAVGDRLRRRRLDRRHVRARSRGCTRASTKRPRRAAAAQLRQGGRARGRLRQAQGDIVVTIDGDLQDDPAEIPRLLAKLDEGFDLVSGWKTQRRDPISRRSSRASSTRRPAGWPACGSTT